MVQNQAAWLDAANKPLRVDNVDMPKATPGRVVVRNHALAINPVDWKVQDYGGAWMKNWPVVIGEDLAGEVVEVGEGVTNVKKGDRVVAHGVSLATNEPTDGCFALYTSVQAATTAKIPDNISYTHGSVIPLALDTAAAGLYDSTSKGFLGLPLPSLTPSPINKTIVVWGGSSSVGALTIQLAVASGVKVISTSSPHNFDFCKKCGASEVFDHRSPSVIDDLVNAVKTSGGEFAGVYDAISNDYDRTASIVEKLGGGILTIVLGPPEKAPANVKIGSVVAIDEVTHPVWAEYVTPALESGQLQCVPEPMVVGRGLESLQKGLDANKKGVSAKKVVVEL